MATNPPPCSHISFNLFTGRSSTGGFPCSSVALTVVDHRRALDPPPILIPCPRYYSPSLYRDAMEDMAIELCHTHLHLSPCCVSRLLPHLFAKIAAVNAAHRCYEIQNVELHVFPQLMPTDDEILRESFEAAEPKPTPASVEAIEKLVKESSSSSSDEDDGACMICLEDIQGTGESWGRMPCSHAFHRSCIVEWLKVSHVCPLCRYQMPVSAVSDHIHH